MLVLRRRRRLRAEREHAVDLGRATHVGERLVQPNLRDLRRACRHEIGVAIGIDAGPEYESDNKYNP